MHSRKVFNTGSVTQYLNRWHDRFHLVTDNHPFYQMARLEMKNTVSIARLATEFASGNNATLFDHCDDVTEVDWTFAQTARWLLASQSFALGFGKSGNARIEGKDEGLPYAADAIALRGMNIWLQGENLFNTLMLNLVPSSDTSSPPWESATPHKYRDRLNGNDRTAITSYGIVDRLTWQSRLVRLLPNGKTCSKMYFTQ